MQTNLSDLPSGTVIRWKGVDDFATHVVNTSHRHHGAFIGGRGPVIGLDLGWMFPDEVGEIVSIPSDQQSVSVHPSNTLATLNAAYNKALFELAAALESDVEFEYDSPHTGQSIRYVRVQEFYGDRIGGEDIDDDLNYKQFRLDRVIGRADFA